MISTAYQFSDSPIMVQAPNVAYSDNEIVAEYTYNTSEAKLDAGKVTVIPKEQKYVFKTDRRVPKVGVMLIGWGGNNGTTMTAGIIANREKLSWETKRGEQHANYYGSISQSSTVKIGTIEGGDLYIPFKNLVPLVNPNDLVITGWDINDMNLGDAMKRAAVYDIEFQRTLYPYMKKFTPMPSIYYPDYIAANQSDRANNLIPGMDKQAHLDHIRADMRKFKKESGVDKVIVLWTANTERYSEIVKGVNDTADNLLKSIKTSHSEVAPSTIFAVAAILEGFSYINGSPQNSFVPGVFELAERHHSFIAGDDFKSGQTKIKSVLVDYLVSAGIKPTSIVSYNHLGNNDGKNLSAPQQFRSKEISKSGVVDDMVGSNGILYPNHSHPDHLIVIKYVPYVGDSKRAMDEYTSEIFCGGLNTIAMHNTCEDSLLAAPLMVDLIILSEICERIRMKYEGSNGFEQFNCVLSILSYLLKAPEVPRGTPVINALSKQRECIVNIFRACLGLQPDNHMMLEYKRMESC